MYETDWIAEFRQKLAANEAVPCSQEQEEDAEEEASPTVKRWLMLADQLLSTDNRDAEPA
jgi:hypothetical protein